MNEITADIAATATIAATAKIWNLVQIREHATIGENVILGRGVYVGSRVKIGDNCKIQNFSMLYEPTIMEQGVFVGPGVVFTNDRFPRAVTPNLKIKSRGDWESVGVYVKEGASIGAGSVCVAPITIGRWAMVAAGSVVTRDVNDFALMAGVPATRIGWVGRAGKRLLKERFKRSFFICPITASRFKQINEEELIELNS